MKGDFEVNNKNTLGKKMILVEQDAGFISPNDERNKQFINEVNGFGKSSEQIMVEPLVLYVVLQKWGVRNRNGRIYPKEILEREVNNYQQLIKEKRAIGELDHPECHRKSAEILTTEGWKLISDISEDEYIYTLNPDTNEIEIKQIDKKIAKPFKGKLISITGRNIDLQVTPNHKFWVIGRNGKGRFITAKDIHDRKIKDLDKMYIPKLGNWVGEDKEFFTLKGLTEGEISNRTPYSRRVEMMSDLKIPMDLWVKFMGIYLADGCVAASKISKRKSLVTEDGVAVEFESPKSGYVCKITQKKEKSKILIRELLDLLPLNFIEVSYDNGKVDFKINDARLHKYLKQFGKSNDKFVPTEIKKLNKVLLNDFLDWFILGDGRIRNGKYKEVFSISKKLIDDLHEIIIKVGKSSNLRIEERNHDRYFGDRLIKKGSSKPLNRLNISTTKGIYLDSRNIKTEYVDYDDYVYCVDVPNHIFYVRDNGKACWNGNSSLIAGDRVSHNITQTWWEGKTLMGKMQILMSPGFTKYGIVSTKGDEVANLIRNGIMIGVSSRGVGSLKEIKGDNIVQDDFEIICWDVVTAPSTPGSWMFKEKEEAKPFMESVNKKTNILVDKINKFLLD